MFDSLEETMKHDEERETSPRERITKYLVTAVLAVAVFGGVLMAIRMME